MCFYISTGLRFVQNHSYLRYHYEQTIRCLQSGKERLGLLSVFPAPPYRFQLYHPHSQGGPIKIIRLYVLYEEVLISNSKQILNSEGGERETRHTKLV